VQTPDTRKGAWSLILISDLKHRKGCAIIQADAETKIGDSLRRVKDAAQRNPHPLLLLIQLIKDYYEVTKDKLRKVNQELEFVDSEIGESLQSPDRMDNGSETKFGILSYKLHEATQKLEELYLRSDFEMGVYKLLQDRLKKKEERVLAYMVNTYSALSNSCRQEIRRLPDTINSQTDVVGYPNVTENILGSRLLTPVICSCTVLLPRAMRNHNS